VRGWIGEINFQKNFKKRKAQKGGEKIGRQMEVRRGGKLFTCSPVRRPAKNLKKKKEPERKRRRQILASDARRGASERWRIGKGQTRLNAKKHTRFNRKTTRKLPKEGKQVGGVREGTNTNKRKNKKALQRHRLDFITTWLSVLRRGYLGRPRRENQGKKVGKRGDT